MIRSGIVLAGGASRRFGGDKLAEPIGGVSLLGHAVRALGSVVDEIVVVIAPDRVPPTIDAGADGPPVRLVRDPEAFGGPLVGIRTGLAAAQGATVIVVGGDMPSLVPAVLELLLRRPPAEMAPALAPVLAAALADEDGRLRPLPCALDRASRPGRCRSAPGGRRAAPSGAAQRSRDSRRAALGLGGDRPCRADPARRRRARRPALNAARPRPVDRGLAGGGSRSRGEEGGPGEQEVRAESGRRSLSPASPSVNAACDGPQIRKASPARSRSRRRPRQTVTRPVPRTVQAPSRPIAAVSSSMPRTTVPRGARATRTAARVSGKRS